MFKLEHLTEKSRAKFITRLAEAVYRYKSSPTREEYEHTRTGHVSKDYGCIKTKKTFAM